MSLYLTIDLNRRHLGKILLEEKSEQYGLEYAPSWLDGGGFPVSPHLKPGECASESVKRFLANLLPAAAMRDMLNWVLFQLLIGNSDAHGKNISFFVGPGGIDMAPAYDLLNLDMYAAEYDRDFSLAIGDSFAPEDISPWELAEMCERCGLQKRLVAKTLATMSEKLLKAMDEVDLSLLLPGDEIGFAGELIDTIRKNVERYLPYAKQLPKIVV